jgi:AraC-like DNA-binding protein
MVISVPQQTAEWEAKKTMIAGFRHHTREFETYSIDLILKNDLSFLDEITVETINSYQLASNPLRSMKNNVICTITVLCRAVIDVGVEPEKCYALSDYYINTLEEKTDAHEIYDLAIEMARHYAALVQEEKVRSFSLPVTRAIRYVYGHLFEPCSVKKIAASLHLHPNYISRIFKSEVGTTLTEYIKARKLEEAKNLLVNSDYRITEIAEMMGYSSLSYFSKDFRKYFGCSQTHFVTSREKPKEPINIRSAKVSDFPR